jgi:predicted HTH domain antitoxin
MDVFAAIGNETELLKTLEAFARYLFDHGRVAEAVPVLERAASLAERQGEETRERLRKEIDQMRRFAS